MNAREAVKALKKLVPDFQSITASKEIPGCYDVVVDNGFETEYFTYKPERLGFRLIGVIAVEN